MSGPSKSDPSGSQLAGVFFTFESSIPVALMTLSINPNCFKVTLFSPDGRTTEPLIVKDNVIICNSGEALFTMERLSKREAPPIGDGTCDCGDCSDEPKT